VLAFRVARRNVSNGFPQGLRSDRIAERMGITGPTVDLHLGRARKQARRRDACAGRSSRRCRSD